MKFLTSTILLGLISLATAIPAPVEKRWPEGDILKSSNSYVYKQSPTHPPPDYTPRIQGVVNFARSTSEVHVFGLPSDWVGKKVRVGFWYNDGGVANNTAVDIYSSSRTPPQGGIGSNNRDQHLGRFWVKNYGDATVRPGEGPSTWQAYQLPAGEESVAFEAVGVGSEPPTDISYEVATSGIYLKRIT